MVKPNYAFAKRQRDLAKKAKKDEKRARKHSQTPTSDQEPEPATQTSHGASAGGTDEVQRTNQPQASIEREPPAAL